MKQICIQLVFFIYIVYMKKWVFAFFFIICTVLIYVFPQDIQKVSTILLKCQCWIYLFFLGFGVFALLMIVK